MWLYWSFLKDCGLSVRYLNNMTVLRLSEIVCTLCYISKLCDNSEASSLHVEILTFTHFETNLKTVQQAFCEQFTLLTDMMDWSTCETSVALMNNIGLFLFDTSRQIQTLVRGFYCVNIWWWLLWLQLARRCEWVTLFMLPASVFVSESLALHLHTGAGNVNPCLTSTGLFFTVVLWTKVRGKCAWLTM